MLKILKALLLNVAPFVSGIAISICYILQLYLTYTTKNVSGQALSFWLILDIALLGLTLQQIGLLTITKAKNYIGLITQILNLTFSLIITIMIILYK